MMGCLKQITWDITKNCNLHCAHCYNGEKYTANYQELDNIDSILKKIYESGIEAVHFLGGEPLVSKNIKYVLSEFKNRSIVTSLVTNGTKLTVDVFEELKDLGLNVLAISLDGIEEINDSIRGKGTYKLVTNNLRNIREKYGEEHLRNNALDKPQVAISHTITNRNVDSFLHFAREMYQIGIRNITLGFILDAGNEKKNDRVLSFSRQQKKQVLLSLEKAFEVLSMECTDMVFSVELRPVYIKYLHMKYGGNFQYKTGYTKCMVYQEFLYLEANGDIHPCNVYSLGGIINFDLVKYTSLELNVKDINSFREALSHPRFELFHKMYKDAKDVYAMQQTLVPTQMCKICFAKQDCEPCPFQFYAEEHFLECEIAFKYYLDLYCKTRDNIITIPEKSVCNMDSQFGKLASKTVEEVVKKAGLSDLIDSIDWKVFQRILKLKKKGFINLEVK